MTMLWLSFGYVLVAIIVTLKCCDQCMDDHDELDWKDKMQALGYGITWPVTALRAFFVTVTPRI